MRRYKIEDMVGRTFVSFEENGERLAFTDTEGLVWEFEHLQDCCEYVSIEDITGSLEDLIGSPILLAEESTNQDEQKSEYDDAFLWTFYKFATKKGYVDVRWYGSSNGYYGVDVDLTVKKDGKEVRLRE